MFAPWQDLPFAVINGIFLTRIVEDDKTRGLFRFQFVIMLTTVMMLVYKAMHLRELPAVWREHFQLLVEQRQLAERYKALQASAPPAAGSDSDSSSDVSDNTASGSGFRDVDTQPAIESLDGLVGHRAPERLGTHEVSLKYDATSDRVAICLVELRNLRNLSMLVGDGHSGCRLSDNLQRNSLNTQASQPFE